MIRRIYVYFLSFMIAISPIILMNQANAAIGGWTLGNPVAQGASAVYDATKTVLINGKNVVKTSAITIAPTAADVAKVLARGGATLALTVAVEQLLGAVDWVLDPANNSIRYYVDPDGIDLNYQYKYLNILYDSVDSAAQAYMDDYNSGKSATASNRFTSFNNCSVGSNSWLVCRFYYYGGGSTNYTVAQRVARTEEIEREEKFIPLTTVAAQVISNAESSTDEQVKVGAQTATMAAAADIVNEAESDDTKARPIATQLDQAATTATDEAATGTATQTKTDPATGESVTETTDIALAFPTFCGWAPVVCEAAQTVISFPQTLTNWWETATTAISTTYTEVKEWATAEAPAETETTVAIDEIPTDMPNTNYLSWNAYCPFTQQSSDIEINGEHTSISSDMTSWCETAVEIKPFVLLAGAFMSLMIVSGVWVRSDD